MSLNCLVFFPDAGSLGRLLPIGLTAHMQLLLESPRITFGEDEKNRVPVQTQQHVRVHSQMLYPPNKPEFQEQTLRLFYWD
jgi:hypothetical protein